MATLTQTAAPYTMSLRHLDSTLDSTLSLPPSTSSLSDNDGRAVFAFVRVHGDVCLAQTANLMHSKSNSNSSSAASLLAPPAHAAAAVELAVFRHEFGTMFRLTRRAKLPARDVQVLAPLDDAGVLLDADSGVVFLSREMTNQLLQYQYSASSPLRRTQPNVTSATTAAALRARRRFTLRTSIGALPAVI